MCSVSILLGCAHTLATPPGPGPSEPPSNLLGEVEDDYGIRYSISEREWLQHPGSRYHIVAWHSEDQFLIAQNDADNPSDGGLWTRIDWIYLEVGGQYSWGFCYSAYAAQSAEEAVSARTADRAKPRTGCNGFPFSRMRRLATSPSLDEPQ